MFFCSRLQIHSRKNQCSGPAGLQLNQNRDPSTLHRARACSTKERGIRATSSKSTPARVMPWMSI